MGREGGAKASARRAGALPRDFHFLHFPSKGFNFLPKRLPKASIPFQKLQKISANLDLSTGYGRMKRKNFSPRRSFGALNGGVHIPPPLLVHAFPARRALPGLILD
jgi:hypothetical protein